MIQMNPHPFMESSYFKANNVLANEQQHTEQSEPIYDTYLLEKVDSNTTLDSTNMCHRGGEIYQDAEQYKVKSPLLKADLINDLKVQLQSKTTLICNLKNQIKSVKEASNEAKVKNDIDVIETINIELEHSVAKLLAATEQLNKENEHLKQTYKELYDSIKKTRVQNKDISDSLISQINQKSVENADLKAQFQEKVFANAALKNELRKLKGNSVDTKFAKPSILGKLVNSRAKVQSPKTRNNNKLVVPKSHTQKPGRQIAIGQRFSPKKSSTVHQKPNPSRSCLRWKLTGRIFKIVGLRWIPAVKMFTDSTTKVDSEPSNGSNDDITNSSEYDQTLNVSAGLALQRQMASADNTSGPYFNPSPSVVQPVLVAVVQEPVVSTGTPSSMRIDQDTPSTSTLQTTQEEQSHVIPTSVEEDYHGIEVKSDELGGSSEGSGITPEVPDEPNDNPEVSKGSSENSTTFQRFKSIAEKQAGYVQTNVTLSSAELEIQSMVDVPIHQEDLAIQRTLLIDPVISMVTKKTASTPTPPTTQDHVQMYSTSCWKDISKGV
ncbi:hypothetical protein Tco_1439427 [Tanacetum coccineum]